MSEFINRRDNKPEPAAPGSLQPPPGSNAAQRLQTLGYTSPEARRSRYKRVDAYASSNNTWALVVAVAVACSGRSRY